MTLGCGSESRLSTQSLERNDIHQQKGTGAPPAASLPEPSLLEFLCSRRTHSIMTRLRSQFIRDGA